MARPPISTHVLDISEGHPVNGLEISLHYKEHADSWKLINTGVTNEDGRCASFLTRETYKTGTYKFRFEVGTYFQNKGIPSLYPFIEIAFNCTATEGHYHVPLLLSPFGYSTYRGS